LLNFFSRFTIFLLKDDMLLLSGLRQQMKKHKDDLLVIVGGAGLFIFGFLDEGLAWFFKSSGVLMFLWGCATLYVNLKSSEQQ